MNRLLTILLISYYLLLPFMLQAQPIIQYNIVGLRGQVLKNVLLTLEGAQKAGQTNKIDYNRIKRLFNQGNTLIRTAMQPYGYFTPSIHSFLERHNATWIFNYHVNPGPSVNINQLKIKLNGPGKNNPLFLKWKKQFPLKIGEIFNSEEYSRAKQSFFTLANNNGYIRAKLKKHQVDLNLDNYSANIHLTYQTGKRYFYGPVHFNEVGLKDSFLRRYLNIHQGQAYSVSAMLKLQRNLSNSGYFKRVSILPQNKSSKNRQIPIEIKLIPLKKMRYILGVGYGTDTGYRGRVGWEWRRINSSGHHLESQYNISQIGDSFGLTYYIPGANPLKEQYSLSANTAFYETDAGESNIQNYTTLYTTKNNLWQTSYGLTFQYEKYKLIGQNKEQAHLLMPTITWNYLRTDNALRPNYGLRFNLNIRGAVKKYFSDISFSQFHLHVLGLYPFNKNNRIFLRGTLGMTDSANFQALPLSLRFTAGGAESVRGYPYQSLGPGRFLTVASAEYQYRIKGNWFAATFQDIGNAFDSFNDMKLKRGTGIGLVWQSPIGTMELDVARSITTPSKSPMVQFSMGTLL